MRRICIILSILDFLFILFLIYNYFFIYHIELIGNKEIDVNVNSKYIDSGVIVKYRGKNIKNYKIEKNIDMTKLGTYFIKYSKGNTKIIRKVNVIDSEAPKITLTGENEINLEYKEKYVELGFNAIDNYDGDISDKVTIYDNIDSSKLGKYEINYKVTDLAGNVSTATRKVSVVDGIKPTIEFKNNINRYSIVGKTIDLNDYIAIDNYDGELTDKVEINGNVDFNKVGKYEVNYSVIDTNNNKATVDRTINVQNKNTKGIPVLMYHWFYDDTKGETAGKVNSHNYIAKTELEKQLKFLNENNFYYPTWQELIDYIDGKIDLPEKSVIITDDDCVDSFFYTALPVFQEYKVPVTSFCITNKSTWKKYIDADYLDFESHTDSLHVRRCKDTKWDGAVMCSTYEEIYNDLKVSVDKVKNTYAFAYPFGHYSDDTIKALKNNNIKLAFTINNGRVKKNSNKYKLPRVRISKNTTIDEYSKLVK